MYKNEGYLRKVGIIFIVVLFAISTAYGSVSPAKSVKSSPAKSQVKKDQINWNKVMDAARKEGRLVMSGDPSEFYRKVFVTQFEKKYPEIKIEYTGMNGRDFRPRVVQERKVGQYLWDMRISGVNPETYDMKGEGFFDPIRPFVLSEVANEGKWHGGFGYIFTDKEQKYFPTVLYFAEYRIWINRDFIPEGQLNSTNQLLDPHFKGKISIQSPKSGGGLAAVAQLFMLYGDNFVKDLFQKQETIITSDKRQQVEWLTRGKYPIALGLEQGFLLDFKKKGVGLNVKAVKNSQDDSVRVIHLLNKAPHPNAAMAYINWILSEEGQREVVKGLEGVSMRKDVEPFDKELPLEPLSETHRRMYEEKVDVREKTQSLVRDLVK